jgi:hypothetical protein
MRLRRTRPNLAHVQPANCSNPLMKTCFPTHLAWTSAHTCDLGVQLWSCSVACLYLPTALAMHAPHCRTLKPPPHTVCTGTNGSGGKAEGPPRDGTHIEGEHSATTIIVVLALAHQEPRSMGIWSPCRKETCPRMPRQ